MPRFTGLFYFYSMTNKLLQLSATEMLEEIGKGDGMPGSGCVSAISAAAGAQLLVSVCKLTLQKPKYQAVHGEIEKIREELEGEYIPKLMDMFSKDIEIVERLFEIRGLRDKEKDTAKKEEYKQKASATLREATESVADMCGTCLDIIPRALFVYDKGLASARGDSAVVISNLLSTVSGALYMTLLNLNAAKDAEWIYDMRSEIETYFGRLHEYQHRYSGRLAGLYNNAWA